MRDRPARRLLLTAALASALVAVAVASAANGRHPTRTRAAVPGSIIVGFKAHVTAKGRANVLAAVDARPTKRFSQIDSTVVSVAPADATWTIHTLENDPRVAYAEPNFILHASDVVPNDPSFAQEWGLNNTGQNVNFTSGTPDADIDATEAWSVSTGSPDVTVAVIDTGGDVSHPDLAANIWINQGANCPGRRTNGITDDGHG